MDLALNKLQCLICHKTKIKQPKLIPIRIASSYKPKRSQMIRETWIQS